MIAALAADEGAAEVESFDQFGRDRPERDFGRLPTVQEFDRGDVGAGPSTEELEGHVGG
jgi:hypothetical protein